MGFWGPTTDRSMYPSADTSLLYLDPNPPTFGPGPVSRPKAYMRAAGGEPLRNVSPLAQQLIMSLMELASQ